MNSKELLNKAKEGDLDAVRHLLEAGENVHEADVYGRTALMIAARHDCDYLVSLLLERGADPKAVNREGKTALDLAKGWFCENLIRKALGLT